MIIRWFRSLVKKIAVNTNLRRFGITSGSYIDPDTAMRVSAFYSGVIYISTQVAKLPWYVKDANKKIIRDSRIAYLLNVAPNSEMDAFSFKLQAIQNAICHGNAYAEIQKDMAGRPYALHPIPSTMCEPFRLQNGNLVYKVMDAEGIKYLQPSEVFHIKNFHTADGLVGQGVVSYGRDVLGISLGADKMAGSLFANSGIPSGVIELEGTLDEEAVKRLRDSWDAGHGNGKSGGTAVLEQGAKYRAISVSPDDLQFLESRKFSVVEIARFLRIPPTKLYDTEASTYNNTENANLEVGNDTLASWAKMFEMQADMKLLSGQFGFRYTEMDLYDIWRGDMTTRSNYYSKMMQSAAMSPNEIRERESLPTYSGGDKFYIANNNYSPVDRIDEIIDAEITSKKSGSAQKQPAQQSDPNAEKITKAAIEFLTGGK